MNNPDRADKRPVTVKRSPLNDRQLEMLLTALLRREDLFSEARSILLVNTFPDHHRNYALVWSIVNDYYDEFGELPVEDYIAAEIETRVDEDPDALSDEEIDVVDLFLRRAFVLDDSLINEKLARRQLKQYLDDRLADDIRKEFSGQQATPEDTVSILSSLTERASSLDIVGRGSLPLPFEPGWDENESLKLHKVPSGLGFLDSMLDGGMALGEVIGLLGPHGSCKTTIAVQLSVDMARRYYLQWRKRGKKGPLKFVYLFIYEGTVSEMRLRALSHAATIERSTLETGDPKRLSRGNRLKPYEKQMFAAMEAGGGKIPSESVRYRVEQNRLNCNLRIVDMTGSDPTAPGRGTGLVPEIVQVIKADQQANIRAGIEAEVGFVTIDYAGAAAERHCEHRDLPRDRNMRHLLTRFPMHCKHKIAVPFNTIVFCNHQLSGGANALAEGRVAKGTDAAEAKSFRENLDFLFVVSNLSLEGRAVINKDKQRRTSRSLPQVVELQGQFSRVNGTDGRYVLDPRRNKIVPRGALHQLGEAEDDQGSSEYPGGLPTHDSADDETAQITNAGL